MKKIMKAFLLIINICNPLMVFADSGLDSNYESSSSMIGGIINAISSSLSFMIKLFSEKPGSDDYIICRNIVSIICIIILYTITAVYLYKLDKRKEKSNIWKLGISLVPSILFTIFCFLTKLYTILYVIVLILLIVPYIIIIKQKLKAIFNNEMNKLKELDNNFNEENFNQEVFSIYKDIQIAWSNFELDKVKELLEEKLYSDYQTKLEDLKKNEQQNVMDNIEFKANKIKDILTENDNITITCEMNVICNDYIINKEEKVIKGKKDKKYDYSYRLVFQKKKNDKKWKLSQKKILKIK